MAVFSSLRDRDIFRPQLVDGGGWGSGAVGVAGEGDEWLEGILLAAGTCVFPKPLQLEGAARRFADQRGTGKGEGSPSQHGARLVITSVQSIVSQFTTERIWGGV